MHSSTAGSKLPHGEGIEQTIVDLDRERIFQRKQCE